MIEELKKYLNETPIEELLKEWEDICKSGPKKGFVLRDKELVYVDFEEEIKLND